MTHSVLIADDDGLIATVILRILGLMDLAGVVVSDGLIAIATAQAMNESLVCVILDVLMPGKSGIEVAKEIRRFAPTLPIIMMSGVISQDLLDRIEGIEYLTVLAKPFTVTELRSLLGSILQK